MESKLPDDEQVMTLVELALAQPENQREGYLESACSGNSSLFEQAWGYVQSEARMRGFLLDPLYPPAEEENPFEPGQLLEARFRIVREVARGGMGIVYEAYDEKLSRRIALKCARAGFRKRLPPEVRHATDISHPNVCKIFEIHTSSTPAGEVDFLTMEFLEGQTLTARLAHGRLPPADARTVADQICAGLAEAHRRRVVHGDLKSNNVILTRDAGGAMRAVITDFGLARRPLAPSEDVSFPTAGDSQAGGTPDYMAPELWKGEKPTAASDVYALGVILHELSAGRRPLPNLHRVKDPTLRRCLEADPSKRFPDAVAVVGARSRRRRWKVAAAVALAAAGLAAITAAVTFERAAPPKEPVRLAMLPLESGPDTADLAQRISRDAAAQLARLQGGPRKQLSFVSSNAQRATHVVHGTIARDNGKIVIHAFLTEARTQANSGDWKAEYTPGEVRFAAVAMAGMTTGALHLPALPTPPVNAAARKDYLAGLAFAHRNSTVDRALPPLENAVAADPDSPLTWAGLAEAQWVKYYLTKDPAWLAQTSESLRQAQNRNLDLAPVHRVAGLLRRQAGLYEQAEAEYLRARELEPGNGDAYRRLGQLYERDHRLNEALAVLKKAVEVAPDDFKTYQDLGAYYSTYGAERDAVGQFEKCVQLAPGEADAHRVLGTAYKDLARYADAERELRIAVRLAETPSALGALASALMFQSRDREAVPFLERAVRQSPNDSLLWMALGIAYSRANSASKSRSAFTNGLDRDEKAVERDPRDGLARARLAFLSARLGDRKRAAHEIAQALQSFSDSKVVQEMAVWTYEALGRRNEALAVLRTSSADVLLDTARWPDLAELQQDSRFQELVASHPLKE